MTTTISTVSIKSCANIDESKIKIKHGAINIKFGNNGVGKTSILKAIEGTCNNNEEMLKDLNQYIYKENPTISIDDSIGRVLSFNESYIDQFLFVPDDLLKNSHSILIDSDNFKKEVKEINSLVDSIKTTVTSNLEITQHITNLNAFISSIKVTSSDKINGTSPLHKALKDGNLFISPSKELVLYGELIKNGEWIKWHKDGTEKFYNLDGEICPFCTSEISDKQNISIGSVKDSFTKVQVDHLVKSLSVLDGLATIVNEQNIANITEIKQSTDKLSDDYEKFILRLRAQAVSLVEKLELIKGINYHELKSIDSSQLAKTLESYKINESLYSDFNTETLSDISLTINNAINEVVAQVGILVGKINVHKKGIYELIKKHEKDINDFLAYAGFDYFVKLAEEGTEYKLKLFPVGSENYVENVKSKLSYGEKNVFAITLFLFEAISSEYDLIILDDPISSFDKNKKFAILHRLFKGENSLVNKTVLLATHDFDVVIDLGYVKRQQYQPFVTYLTNESGVLTEDEIFKDDILSYKKICFDNIKKFDHSFISIIYLRRLLEIGKDVSHENLLSWNYVSSLLHRKPHPTIQRLNEEGKSTNYDMTDEDIKTSLENIFNLYGLDIKGHYEKILVLTKEDLVEMYADEQSRYVKLQLFRIIHEIDELKFAEKDRNSIILKFMHETYHSENDYLYDLDPNKFERIPKYVIEMCDKLIS